MPKKRTVKDPEVRRDELIVAAEELFSEKGYESTAVKDIVNRVGVAQGTFYYHFKSKEDILDVMVDRLVGAMVKSFQAEVPEKDVNAVDRILTIIRVVIEFSKGREKLIDDMHHEKNALLHLKIETGGLQVITPIFEEIVRQGVEEGLFSTKYPQETAKALIASLNAINQGDVIFTKEKLETLWEISDRILGAEPGTFSKHAAKMNLYE